MTTLQRSAFLMMRVSLGAVFLLFGIGKLNNDIWAQTIRTMDIFLKLPWDVNVTVTLIGIAEIVTGLGLIAGFLTRVFAAVAAVQLAMILVLLKFEETRDIGLWGAALYMTLIENDAWGIDGWFKMKGGRK